jgi:hypothetical protein
MSRRETDLLWLKDTIGHLAQCQQQLQWADNPETVHVVTETMLRDLGCCRRLCEALHEQTQACFA